MEKIAVIGLGYVGLPLAVEFGKILEVTGYDIKPARIDELKKGTDSTLEVSDEELASASNLRFTSEIEDIRECNIYIITVPTPIDQHKKPDLKPLLSASKTVGSVLSKGDLVIFESTVYPGCTEDDCVPILENESGFTYNKDFFCGYSPERINPGDKKHRLPEIQKVTSGSNEEIASKVDALYKRIIKAGTHKVSSIKVAEAAKVIENAQRDLNIAFVNELSLIFDRIGIDTHEVLEAAGTKWNFLPFKPGLVGGHCIGVDPYYLTYKAESLGYHPQVILAGRRINDNMPEFIAGRVIKLMARKDHPIKGGRILVLGITFKENCPDIRNSKVIDVIHELQGYGAEVDVYDPWASPPEVKEEYGLDLIPEIGNGYNAVVLAVGHNQFHDIDFESLANRDTVIYDVKGFLEQEFPTGRL